MANRNLSPQQFGVGDKVTTSKEITTRGFKFSPGKPGTVIGSYASGHVKVRANRNIEFKVHPKHLTKTSSAAEVKARRSSGAKAAANTRKIRGRAGYAKNGGPVYYGANKGWGSMYD